MFGFLFCRHQEKFFDKHFDVYSRNADGQVERMYNKLDGLSGKTVHYNYNRLGEPIHVQYQPGASDSHYWWYTYDQPGRVDLVRSNTTTSQVTDADYSYWPAGMVNQEVLGTQTISYTYVAKGDRLAKINNVSSSTHRFSAEYFYQNNGNINVAQYHQPSSTHSHKRYRYVHTYDKRNQITSANYSWWNGSSWQYPSDFDVSDITYDKDSNHSALTRRTDTGSANTYGYSYASGSNRLTSVNKNLSNISLGYDHNGNTCPTTGVMTSITGDYNITATSYDWRSLPLSITKSGTTYSYKYDHQGNRTYKTFGVTRYVRGAFGEVLAVYWSSFLAYHNILRPDGTVIGRRHGSNRLYYHRGHHAGSRTSLGSTRAVVNGSGSVVKTQDYYPFCLAELVPNTFGMPGRSLTTGNLAKEKFTKHACPDSFGELDGEVDLYETCPSLRRMIARRYAPEFGRFLSPEPLADSIIQPCKNTSVEGLPVFVYVPAMPDTNDQD